MKKIVTSVIVVLSALTACTVQNQGQSYDEVYYNPKDKSAITEMKKPLLHKQTKEVEVKADTGYLSEPVNANAQDYKSVKDAESYVTDNSMNNNFNYDDYYDYSYASRIRRFQYGYFNDYYHDFYTNRYWYDYNPWYWGSSIYSNWGMNPGLSFYMDPFSYSWGFYSPFSSFYNPFYSPFSYGYSPWGYDGFGYYGFWNGYNRGYYDGYYGYGYGYGGGYGYGYGGGYSNIYDHNSTSYYGPRRNASGSNGPTPAERTAFTQRYNAFSNGGGSVASVSAPRNGREVMNANTAGAPVNTKAASTSIEGINQRETGNRNNLFAPSNANAQRSVNNPVNNREQLNRKDVNRYISDPANNPQVNQRKPDARTFQQQQDRYFKDKAVGNPPTKAARENSNIRYTKPQQDAAPQQYYNPVNSRPRSGNEYTSPRYRNPGEYNTRQVAPQRSVSDPQRYTPPRVNQTPVTNPGNRRDSYNYRSPSTYTPSTYSTPSRSSYSAPSSTYSAPSQSYSAPSQSYSAPSGNARESSSSSNSSNSSSTGPRR